MLIIIFGGLFQQGTSPKWLGKMRKELQLVLSPVSLDELLLVTQEIKVRTCCFRPLPEDHTCPIFIIFDEQDIWMQLRSWFGGNEESKKYAETYASSSSFRILCDRRKKAYTNYGGESLPLAHYYSAFIGAACSGLKAYYLYQLFEKKAGRKMNYNNKQPARFDRRKVRCYKCLQLGHFARECNVKTVDDKARYSAFKVTEVKTDEPKALVSVDSMVNNRPAVNSAGRPNPTGRDWTGVHLAAALVSNPAGWSKRPSNCFDWVILVTDNDIRPVIVWCLQKISILPDDSQVGLFGPTNYKGVFIRSTTLSGYDDCSRFTWTFFLGTKDETFYVLKEFIALIENQLNKKVKGIRCDNGTEFKNAKLIELYGEKGIKRDYSNPRTPQQNGVAERKNRTLYRGARNHGVYYYSFIKHLMNDNTGDGSSVGHHLDILLGVNKAYRVYNLTNKRVEETMNLRFLEDKPNVQGIGHEWYFDLDYLSDSLDSEYCGLSKSIVVSFISFLKVVAGSCWLVSAGGVLSGSTSADSDPARCLHFLAARSIIGLFLGSSETLQILVPYDVCKDQLSSANLSNLPLMMIISEMQQRHLTQKYGHFVPLPVMAKNAIGTKWILRTEGCQRWTVRVPFFYGEIKEEVYVTQPKGFWTPYSQSMCTECVNALYGHPSKQNHRAVYGDDIIFGSTNKGWCEEFEVLMKGEFEMSAMGEMSFFLGLQTKLKDETDPPVNVHLYRSMIGSLMYLTASRPDIMFAALWLPKDSQLAVGSLSSEMCYVGGSHGDRKSTFRVDVNFWAYCRRLISWQCKKQTIVATSSIEAEYVAAASCCGQVLWIQNQLLDYGFNFMNTKIFIDNQSTICKIVQESQFFSLKDSKHIEFRHQSYTAMPMRHLMDQDFEYLGSIWDGESLFSCNCGEGGVFLLSCMVLLLVDSFLLAGIAFPAAGVIYAVKSIFIYVLFESGLCGAVIKFLRMADLFLLR
ncbi:retrovirus-related pol polyprotein from transposon TNT 1-94 [Tanacetum coccineum]